MKRVMNVTKVCILQPSQKAFFFLGGGRTKNRNISYLNIDFQGLYTLQLWGKRLTLFLVSY